MNQFEFPQIIPNWIDGRESETGTGETFAKFSPVTGKPIGRVARSRAADVARAIESAANAFPSWSAQTPVARGDIVLAITRSMREKQERIASVVSAETGMSLKAALAETAGAIAQGEFMAGEGRRLYGRTTTSAAPNRWAMTVREHTRSVHRALEFTRRVQAGVAVVNAGTFGSESHMPFGGVKQSSNGSREPGTEALDIYSNLKNVILTFDPNQI